jgi:hypothetical protein
MEIVTEVTSKEFAGIYIAVPTESTGKDTSI